MQTITIDDKESMQILARNLKKVDVPVLIVALDSSNHDEGKRELVECLTAKFKKSKLVGSRTYTSGSVVLNKDGSISFRHNNLRTQTEYLTYSLDKTAVDVNLCMALSGVSLLKDGEVYAPE